MIYFISAISIRKIDFVNCRFKSKLFYHAKLKLEVKKIIENSILRYLVYELTTILFIIGVKNY
jgi:hypothetical protein